MATQATKQFKRDRRQLLVKRKVELGDDDIEDIPDNADEEESDGSVEDSESDSDDEASVVSFDQVSDDEDLIRRQKALNSNVVKEEEKLVKKNEAQDINSSKKTKDMSKEWRQNELRSDQETTHSLALRLLDINVGYSSDEGGDEDCAYFLDGVDETFTTRASVDRFRNESDDSIDPSESTPLPVRKSEFDGLGVRAKICSSILLADHGPDVDDFDNYPLPSSKEMKAEEELKANIIAENNEQLVAPSSPVKLSKTKVEQISIVSNEVIRVWKSAEDAAATLQTSLKDIKEVLSGAYNEDLGDEVGGYRWRYAPEDAEVTKIATINENDKGKKAFLEFRDKLYDHTKPHEYKNGNRLRDYQVDGVNWLSSCWYKKNGCILADEMGLGKTVQIVSYIEHLNRVEKIQRPFLVVVPLSTVEHWRREFEGWTDLKICVYHDRQRVWRDVMREYEWYYADRPRTPDFLKFDVLVTTYDTLIGDFDVIGQIPWRVTVVDEAHRLRNQKGKLLECMKEISAKGTLQHGYQSRVLMTGTPLQNNIQELWTLLNFIEPYKFPSIEEFEAHYGNMENQDQVIRLQNKISPFMLRRVKEDVAKDIPAKEETLIDVELTSIQKQYYRAIFEHNHSFLNMGNSRNVAPKLMNIQMELRKCCNHPFLLDGIEHRETEKQQRELLESGEFDGKTPEEIQTMVNVKGYIDTSGKMVLLDKLLPKLRREGHKVLIFSQMVKMLDLLAEYCDFRSFKYERLGKFLYFYYWLYNAKATNL
jgi:chromodomain-helicase-DNA-binding protein 7